jgi:hypothetical protein
MEHFEASLCLKHPKQRRLVGYKTVTIEADSRPKAIERAKEWAETVKTEEGLLA